MTDTLASWLETVVPMYYITDRHRTNGRLNIDEAWVVREVSQDSVETLVRDAVRGEVNTRYIYPRGGARR